MTVEPMVYTILPKVDNMGTSSMVAPMTLGLVAGTSSKASYDTLFDPNLLNSVVVVS
jgi:hypothetical protein